MNIKRMFTMLFFLSMVLFFNNVHADRFQFLDKEGDFYAAYSDVYINGELKGRTDKYGRIIIRLSPGEYECKVVFRGEHKSLPLQFDGNPEIKTIKLN